jgi:hypothetical protein
MGVWRRMELVEPLALVGGDFMLIQAASLISVRLVQLGLFPLLTFFLESFFCPHEFLYLK